MAVGVKRSLSEIALPTTPSQSASAAHADYVNSIPSYAYGLNLKNKFDGPRGIYNSKASNTRKLDQSIGDAAAGGHSHHLFIGDSVTGGANSSIGIISYDWLRSWPLAMQTTLAAMGVPANGTGYVRVVADGNAGDSRWALAGTWQNAVSYAYILVAGGTATFSPNHGGTIFELNHYGAGTGTITISIDGATSGANFLSFTPNGTATWQIKKMTGCTITSTSKIVVTLSAAGNGMYLGGASVWTPGKGLIIDNISQSGSRAQGTGNTSWDDTTAGSQGPAFVHGAVSGTKRTITDAATTAASTTLTSASAAFTAADVGLAIDQFPDATGNPFPPNTYIAAFLTSTTVTMSAPAQVTASGKTMNIGRVPAVVHIALGLNDLGQALSVSGAITAITNVRNRYPTSDCIIHLVHEPSTAYASSASVAAFQQAMYTLADTLDVVLYDWRDRAGSYATAFANGMFGDYLVHLEPGSYESLGASLALIIGPAGGRPQGRALPVDDEDLTTKQYVDDRTKSAVCANASVLTTVETPVLSISVPANRLKLASTMDYQLFMHPAASTITTVRVRIGTTGTISDAAVIVMSATVTASTASRWAEGVASILSIGTAGTILGGGSETVGAVTAAGAATATSGTFDSTKNNIITVTVQNTTSTTTTVYSGRAELSY